MANPIPYSRCLWTVLVFTLTSSGGKDVLAQQTDLRPGSSPPTKVTEVPERFFQIQDKLGFFWQAFGNGALVSGDTQYLQSGLNLIVDGAPFSPAEVFAREPAVGGERIDLQLLEKRADSVVSRDLWFDTERSAVRVLDTVSNTSNTEKTYSVSLRTTYPFSWQSLHGSGGALLSSNPGLQLNPGDFSLGVHFSPSDGRHDTFFIVGSEKGAQKPEIKASANSRELTFAYSLVLPPGESRSLVHWILQRNLSDVSADREAISPFFQRGRLIQPGIDPAVASRVVNFEPSAFQNEPAATAQLKSLVALNGLMDRLGFHRRAEDLLWVSPTNQVSGVVGRESVLTVATAWAGEQEVKIQEIAAIRGSAGNRRNSLIYLRNGGVLSGEVTKGEISWSVGEGAGSAADSGGILLDPDSLNLLLFATEPSDGVPPSRTTHFLQLTDGSVMPLVEGAGPMIRCNTPWGEREFSLSEILEVAHTLSPYPHHRVILKSGSSVTAFLGGEPMRFESLSGEETEVNPAMVERIWVAGTAKLLADAFTETWLDFSELPPGVGPKEGFLLSGNTLLEGRFADEFLFLVDVGGVLRVEVSQIQAMRRSDVPANQNLLEIELLSGEKIGGELSAKELRIVSPEGETIIPADQVLGYRGKAS